MAFGNSICEPRGDAMPKKPRGALSLNFLSRAILAMAPLTASSPANADAFIFTQIDVPGAFSTAALGINNAGQIVGSFNQGVHGFLDAGGSFTQIDVPFPFCRFPGACFTEASGINNAGQIVGSFGLLDPGFLLTGGSFTQIDVPGATS